MIYTYSERGIVDSLIYSLNDFTAKEFLCLAYPELKGKDICNIDFYIEHSLSDFGDPDLIITYKLNNVIHLIFVEAKVANETNNWELKKQYNDFESININSNIFWQISLKKLLIKNIRKDLKIGICSEDKRIMRKKEVRKIGNNPVVNKLVYDLIINIDVSNISYLGLVPECESMLDELKNNDLFKDLRFITWEQIYKFAEENAMKSVKECFDWNGTLIYSKNK